MNKTKRDDEMNEIETKKESIVTKVKRYISVEPLLFATNIPLFLLVICLQNLTLEKACRVNLGFPDLVCDHMMDKALNNINCGDVSDRQQSLIFSQANFTNITIAMGVITSQNNRNNTSEFNSTNHDFEMEVCRAELESQKLGSTINAYMAPFESAISIVLVLFAGSWSDRSGKRKPCIIIPQIGRLLEQLVNLIAAIFMKQLPVEFNAILGSLLAALSGSWPLMFIGLFSYLTEVTEEKDRVFRFGIIYQLFPIIAICTLPFSGVLYQQLGYIKLISLCTLLHSFGILYAFFILKEPKARVKGVADKELVVMLPSNTEKTTTKETVTHTTGNICSNVLKDCFTVIFRKRDGHGRKIVYLILVMVALSTAVNFEIENEYYFVRTKLNWEALEEAPFAAYGSAIKFFGMTFMISVLRKCFKVSDTMLALISSVFSGVSKFVCITVSSTFMFYVAKTLDMFGGMRTLVGKSIMATVVDNTEIGKIYSVMGVLENLSKFLFVPIYSNIYKYTVDSFPNAYFICSFVIIIVVTILCWTLNHWERKHSKLEPSNTQPVSTDSQSLCTGADPC